MPKINFVQHPVLNSRDISDVSLFELPLLPKLFQLIFLNVSSTPLKRVFVVSSCWKVSN